MKKSLIINFLILLFIEKELMAEIPVITTNAHHHSVSYWLKEEFLTGTIKGLPILHLDSHTDMGFIPSHYKHKKKYFKTNDLLINLTLEKIKSFQSSLKNISQVIVPAIATGLTNKVHMCMPPWFKRFSSFDKIIPFSVQTFNKAQFINSTTHRIYPVTRMKNTSLSSPFIHLKRKILPKAYMTFYKCFDNPSIPIKTNYILSLDLDILSTNGIKYDYARPISPHRSSNNKISKKEKLVFYERIKKIKALILNLKKRGSKPRIVTIALSTEKEGGNYTPPALAKEANKIFIDFFKLHFKSVKN